MNNQNIKKPMLACLVLFATVCACAMQENNTAAENTSLLVALNEDTQDTPENTAIDCDSCYAGIPAMLIQYGADYRTASPEQKLKLVQVDTLCAHQRLCAAEKEFSALSKQVLPIEEPELFLRVRQSHLAVNQLRAKILISLDSMQKITAILDNEEKELYQLQKVIEARQQQLASMAINPNSLYLNATIIKRLIEQAEIVSTYRGQRVHELRELYKQEFSNKNLLLAQYRILHTTLVTLQKKISSVFEQGNESIRSQCIRFTRIQEQYRARKKQYEEWRQLLKELYATRQNDKRTHL